MLKAEPMDRIKLPMRYAATLMAAEQCEVIAKYLPQSMPEPPRFLDVRVSQQWSIGHDFLATQPHLNARMWPILYDWLAVVSYKFKLEPRRWVARHHANYKAKSRWSGSCSWWASARSASRASTRRSITT